MNEEQLKEIAAQLRQPHGEMAHEVSSRMNKGNQHMNLFAIQTLNPQQGDAILEIGMGNGFFVKDILSTNPSIQYTGCDFSEAMVAEATALNAPYINSSQALFHLASADNLPFTTESFDKIFTVNTIYFWDNPTTVLDEMKRVLKPDGQLLIALRSKSVMEVYPFTQYGFIMYNADDLNTLLSENGLKITQILEEYEPDQEINGETIIVSSMVVCAKKIN